MMPNMPTVLKEISEEIEAKVLKSEKSVMELIKSVDTRLVCLRKDSNIDMIKSLIQNKASQEDVNQQHDSVV
jgi:hypothetical protein